MEGLWRDDYDFLDEWTVFAYGHKARGILSESFLQEQNYFPDLKRLKKIYMETDDVKSW